MTDGKKREVKQKAMEEGKRLFFITAYLWALLTVFELHRVAVLRAQHVPFTYRVGFALINALVLAKVILIADALHAGKRVHGRSMVATVCLKSGLFAIILVCFNIVEEVSVGLLHGKTLVASMPDFAGGGPEGELLVGIMMFVVLIPFFGFTELRQAIGKEQFDALILRHKAER
jgi:hypothetical protein